MTLWPSVTEVPIDAPNSGDAERLDNELAMTLRDALAEGETVGDSDAVAVVDGESDAIRVAEEDVPRLPLAESEAGGDEGDADGRGVADKLDATIALLEGDVLCVAGGDCEEEALNEPLGKKRRLSDGDADAPGAELGASRDREDDLEREGDALMLHVTETLDEAEEVAALDFVSDEEEKRLEDREREGCRETELEREDDWLGDELGERELRDRLADREREG